MSANEKAWFKNYPVGVPKQIDYPDVPLSKLLSQSARNFPENVALSFLDEEISYRELDEFSDQFAAALIDLGVRKKDRVALFLPNVPQFVIAYYGILKIGAVLTTLSPMLREREVEYQLNDSESKIIVTLDSLLSIVESIWQKTKLNHVIITKLEDLSKRVISEESKEQNRNVHRFKQLLKKRKQKPPEIDVNPNVDLAALQYTGGTTGTPKAAMLTHMNLVSNTIAFATWIRGKQGVETFLAALPLFHIYGMTTSMNVPIFLADKVVLIPRFEPVKVLEAISENKVAVFCGVPTMYQALLANPELAKYDLTSIRVCISGASPLPPQVQRKFMQTTGGLLAEGYGLTEASPVTHCGPVEESLRKICVGSIGLPLPDTEAKIVDIETGKREVEVGETGELVVRGPQVMKGYWKQPYETELVLRNGWLLTGDVARMDADGFFYITDRKKDLIKYKDYSVYPREIEDVLYENPKVKLCAVVGKPDNAAGEIPKAYIVLKDGVNATSAEIIEFVKERVAPYKLVREVEFKKELPISSAGKPLRRQLRDEGTGKMKEE